MDFLSPLTKVTSIDDQTNPVKNRGRILHAIPIAKAVSKILIDKRGFSSKIKDSRPHELRGTTVRNLRKWRLITKFDGFNNVFVIVNLNKFGSSDCNINFMITKTKQVAI